MNNYVISMKGTDSDPIHLGDMASWFFCYKWRPDENDEVFFPIGRDELPEIAGGDSLWFLLDGALVGQVDILRVEDDPINQHKELWYETQRCKEAKQRVTAPFPTGPIDRYSAQLLSIGLSDPGEVDQNE